MTELHQKKRVKPGKLFIICGPSGVGKTTIAQAVIARINAHCAGSLVMVRSYTTRKPRPNEAHGVDYWFISPEEFDKKQEEQFFLEYSTAYQASYGSSYQEIMELLEKGCSVLVVIDRRGVEQILKRIFDAVIIQILPPAFEVLRERLQKRSDLSEKDIEFRMQQSQKELKEERRDPLARFIIVNDDLEDAIESVCAIISKQIYS